MNAQTARERMTETVARIREQFAATGTISLEDYMRLFGDPMQSVSFRELHEKVEREGAAARRRLGGRLIEP